MYRIWGAFKVLVQVEIFFPRYFSKIETKESETNFEEAFNYNIQFTSASKINNI